MRLTRVIAVGVIAASLGLGLVEAQTLSDIQAPAEFPPASYKGRQYVDSNGCVFVRAGIDGNVTWVPRVTRGRKVICGFKPSLAQTRKAETVTTPKQAASPEPAAKPAKPKAAGKTAKAAPAAKPKSAPETRKTVRVRVIRKPAAPARKTAKPATAAKPPRTAASAPSGKGGRACPEATPLSRKYLNWSGGQGVRCGPQTTPHVTRKTTSGTAKPAANPAAAQPKRKVVRIVRSPQPASGPGKLYRSPYDARRHIYVPAGYKPVWDDDRLNPNRGGRTAEGQAQMEAAWTNTVPRELVDRPAATVIVQPPTISTKGSAGTSRPDPARHRYVQAGTYGEPANAQRAAQRIANAGLPARKGKVRRGGRTYQIVLAGPFETRAGLTAALRKLRAMGYSDAFLRK